MVRKATPPPEPEADDKKTDTPKEDKAKPEAKTPEPAQPAPDEEARGPDVDESELADAQKALAEETGEAKPGEPAPEGDKPPEGDEPAPEPESKPEPTATPTPTPEGDDKEPAKPAAVPMIPKPRLDEEIGKREKAQQGEAYWRGVAAEQLRAATAPGAVPGTDPAAAVQKTPADIIAEARAEQLAIAKGLDDGDLSTEEWQVKNATLDDTIYAAREANLRATLPVAAQPVASGDSLTLAQLTVKLEDDHPIVHKLTDDDWPLVEMKAMQMLAAEGTVIPSDAGQRNDNMEYIFRRKKAEVADLIGPALVAARGGEKPVPADPDAQPVTTVPASGLSPIAAARAAKLDKAADAPPDASQLGSPGTSDTVSEAAIAEMTDDQIMALPESQRRKILTI